MEKNNHVKCENSSGRTDDALGRTADSLCNVTTCEELNTLLIDSIPDGDIAYMKRIMAKGANPNATCRLGHVSACHIAAMFDHNALDLLLSSGADRCRSDKHGSTPLHLAAWAGNLKQIALLLNFPEALIKRMSDHCVLSHETVRAITRFSIPVNKLTNLPCRLNFESTLSAEWSDGLGHNCASIKEMLPVFEPEWTALHAASARAQHLCVELLLAAGADASAQDLLCRTPLDVAGCAYYSGHDIDVNSFMKTVDLLLKAGAKFNKCCDQSNPLDTPLHTAVALGSEAAVELLLQAGASVTMWNRRGCTAMHMCIQTRDKELLQLLANHTSSNEGSNLASIDVVDRRGRTVLWMAVRADWLEGVRIALNAGATNIKQAEAGISFESSQTTVFHLAARLGSKDVLEYLLNFYEHKEVKKQINTFDVFAPPLYYAIDGNHDKCARLLIYKGTELNIKNNIYLDLAVERNRTIIAEMIIKTDEETLHAVNRYGQSPLYAACIRGHREMIALLLRNGADLSGGENGKEREFVPMEMLMNNLSKPTEFMQDIFNSNITFSVEAGDIATVTVNFQVLLPRYDREKMRVIQALLNTGNRYDQQKLLLHPFVESFLFLQWRSILPFFFIILALHACFAVSLNVFALSLFWYKDRHIEPVPIVFRCSVWIYIIYLTAALLIVQEVMIIKSKRKTMRYLFCLETSVKCLSTILAVVLPQIVSWDSKYNPEWVRLFGSVTLLLTWVRMMYLLSRLPDWGYYILMYGRVAIKVLKILASHGFFIIGCCISIMIQYYAQPPFEDLLSSLLTMMVMMTSELGYIEILNKTSIDFTSAYMRVIRLIFVSFFILVSIVLINLLVGVAVNDVNALENIGNISRLKKQVHLIQSFKDTDFEKCIAKILPKNLYKRWFDDKITENLIYLSKLSTRVENCGLPDRLIKDLFENARLQNRQSHEQKSTKLYEIKLDEIHEVIIKNHNGVPAKPDISDNAKLLEEITILRTDVELIKNRIDKISDALNLVISNLNHH